MLRIYLLGLQRKIYDALDNYAVPFSAGLLLAMLLQTCFGLQTFSNLVTGVSALVTALIAYKALAVGRDYVGKMMTEEGYKKAIILKDDIMPKFFSEQYSRFYLSSALGMINVLFKAERSEHETRTCLSNLNQYATTLKKHANYLNKTGNDFSKILASTKTHGLTLSKEYISDFFGAEHHFFQTDFKLRAAANYIELVISPYFKPTSDIGNIANLKKDFNSVFWNEKDREIKHLIDSIRDAEIAVIQIEDYMIKYEKLRYMNIKDIFHME
ncbi:hypothetical protein [Pantoea endophytica]|uniref:hypothetical protein n=1 Tax=Pantoea endophytica TaxID=92488 RepID=UPI0028A2CA20|nr:hypothetical protein [Pantoea endophytica]